MSPLFVPANSMPATPARQVQIDLRGIGVRTGGAYVGTLFVLMYAPLRIHRNRHAKKTARLRRPRVKLQVILS
ncbi:hypothetical protein SBA2_630045 [Acidobacteriia bacterium SbA2]|nr:hypothetical protein SBA2_630045 [Acidobacteriia bacterium SbA2]